MEIIDKRILFYLLKDGRISQRKIATLLGLTPATLNYRFKRLAESGILKGFKLYVNPNFYSKYQFFIVFKNYNDINADWLSFKLRCLEWYNVYGVSYSDNEDMKDKMEYMTKQLGEPVLKYLPAQSLFKPSNLDKKIVEILKTSPRLPSSDIAKKLGVSARKVEKQITYLKHRGLILVVPQIDVGRADIVLFSIFSKNIEDVSPVLQDCKIWQFTDGYAGITACYADNIETAKKYINGARQVDKNADVMIISDYDFKA